MTAEEKARAYDKALEKARKLYEQGTITESLSHVFPEFKESEDERIRGAIIDHLEDNNLTEWAAWLEKQGNKPQKTSIWKHWKDGIAGNGEGEPIYLIKYGRTYSLSSCLGFECDYIELSELDKLLSEKQGEQKPTDKVEPKFKVGDIIRFKGNETLKREAETHKIVSYDNELYVFADGTTDLFCEQDLYELVEQKPAYKIELKFHEGDWVVFNNKHQSIYQVEKIEDGYYILRHTHGGTFRVCVLHDESLRLWTIQDAKDGDVLADKYNNIGIFQKCEGICWHSYIYLGCDGELRGFYIGGSHEQTDTHPATKEQCDLLFQKMEEVGYEWYAKKKELKKIEHKFAGKENKSCIKISKAHKRIYNLRRMIPYWNEIIRQSKLDISSCISHGLVKSDYVPFEIYSFGTAIARLDEARFMINSIGKEIRLLKKEISLENKKYDISMR